MKLTRFWTMATLVLFSACGNGVIRAAELDARLHFQQVRHEPALLRGFLYAFPKGGELHNHLDGAIYAESYIRWGAEDGKCIDLENHMVMLPPCDTAAGRPPLREVQFDGDVVNRIIDAFSIRNYERRPVSGHNQFFSTFGRFYPASFGREGYMLAESSARSARQNMVYLELLQSWGMTEARQLAADGDEFNPERPLAELLRHPGLEQLAAATITRLDAIEQQWRDTLACGQEHADPGCGVTVRYLAQVIRTFPRAQVLAQTLLAYHLIEKDPRYVGLNFVAPEDDPIALRDYRWQMAMIGELAGHFPAAKDGITLHAGELDLGLVAPEHLGWHVRAALDLAGARRIGHGTDILHDPQATQLLERMAEQGILVEINLTSSEAILGITGAAHPFETYLKHNVPIALSTDDEGVARIDLTHEYQRAVETYNLSYDDLKYLSRNALAYSFLPGQSLLESTRTGQVTNACDYDQSAADVSEDAVSACLAFMFQNEKAQLQAELERRFDEFEAGYPQQR